MKRKVTFALSFLVLSSCVHLAAEVATNDFRRETVRSPRLATPSVAEQDARWCETNDCSRPVTGPVNVLIDTHAHLSMGPGMGFVFSGKPWDLAHEPLWSDRFSEKMGVEHLRRAGYGIVVVSLYANVFAIWPKDSVTAIYEEIEQTRDLVRRYPDLFTITTTSTQARRAIAEGKIALIMHLEAAEWVMRSEEEVAALYREGVRAVNPIHLYDSWIGGTDLQAGSRFFLNPPGFGNSHLVNGRRENRTGLTMQGKRLLEAMKDYGMIIDVSHFSRQALRDLHVMPRLAEAPVFNSHMPDLYTSTSSERGVDPEAFAILRMHEGLLGLVPTAHSPEILEHFPGLCPGTIETFGAIYAEAVSLAAGMPIALASDFNGGIGHVKPTHGEHGCYPADQAQTDFQRHGLAHAGYLPAALDAMRKAGVDVTPMYDASERFLQMMERAEQLKRF